MVNKYVLMVINVFSKYGWAEPLKTKSTSAVTSAFKKIFKDNHPKRLWIMGRNFTIRQWKICYRGKIFLYTHNDEKANVVERWNNL